ncbi:hypothetical protein GGF46_004834 [Coemansia sp. RSA 552]|nr:hypothetical protein GGF46_004834 [Coemansia sp. RSA 552]
MGVSDNKVSTTHHDSNLVDILFSSALDGEYVRDQISGTYRSYDPGAHQDDTPPPSIDAAQLQTLRTRELQAIRTAENGHVDAAVSQLTQVIADCPQYASAYNNRAQALRLQGAPPAAILLDLDAAIRLATGPTLAQAFTQKGIVLHEQGDQDSAFYCFSQGAKHGSEFARVAAARENPYAKLCGQMVSQAMQKLRTPPSTTH